MEPYVVWKRVSDQVLIFILVQALAGGGSGGGGVGSSGGGQGRRAPSQQHIRMCHSAMAMVQRPLRRETLEERRPACVPSPDRSDPLTMYSSQSSLPGPWPRGMKKNTIEDWQWAPRPSWQRDGDQRSVHVLI